MHKNFIAAFLVVSIASMSASQKTLAPTKPALEDKWVTIFIHGGGAHPTYLNISDVFKIIDDDLDRPSVYKKTTELLREDPYFFKVHPQTYKGLHKVWPIKNIKQTQSEQTPPEQTQSGQAWPEQATPEKKHGAHIFAEMFNKINTLAGLPQTDLYSFGWTGLLSITARRAAAQKFYDALAKLAKRLRKQGYNLRIRIIGYSHGGNASLHLAEVAQNKKYTPFSIDELILISTPVHANTEPYITSPLFKKIYLFYSKGDNIQLDFLSSPTHSFASHLFMGKNGVTTPKNVTQIQVRFFRTHLRIKQPDGTIKKIVRNEMVHPNHTEMFFFGWTPEWYRKYFPIRPLSVSLLIPFFLRDVEQYNLYEHHLRFTVYPETGQLNVKVKDEKRSFEAPFIKPEKLIELRKDLQEYSPQKRLPHKEYHEHMVAHREEAKKYVHTLRKTKLKALRQKRKQKKEPTCSTCNVALFRQPISIK